MNTVEKNDHHNKVSNEIVDLQRTNLLARAVQRKARGTQVSSSKANFRVCLRVCERRVYGCVCACVDV